MAPGPETNDGFNNGDAGRAGCCTISRRLLFAAKATSYGSDVTNSKVFFPLLLLLCCVESSVFVAMRLIYHF